MSRATVAYRTAKPSPSLAAHPASWTRSQRHTLDLLGDALAELDDLVYEVADCRIAQSQGLPAPQLSVALAQLERAEARVNALQDEMDRHYRAIPAAS